MIEDRTYYFISNEAKVVDGDLYLPDLPPVRASNLHLSRLNERQVVTFLDPTLDPALHYIERLHRVGMKKDSSPS